MHGDVELELVKNDRDLRGLRALAKEKSIPNLMLVTLDPIAANHGPIRAVPVHVFLKQLWQGELF